MKQSGFLKKQARQANDLANVYKDIDQQFMLDTLQITLNRHWGFGFDRLMRLTKQWEAVRAELYPAINPNNPECDVQQEHMQKAFEEICRGKGEVIPFYDRYPYLKRVRYDGKR